MHPHHQIIKNATMAKSKSKGGSVSVHTFKACRESFLTPAPRTTPGSSALVALTDASGNGSFGTAVCPLGLTGATISGTTFANGTSGNVLGPPLRSFFNRSIQFQMYRVTRARFIFVSSVGSNALGVITLAAYTDPVDISTQTAANYLSSANTKTFDLGSGASRELSVPVPVDSSWKKVSSDLTCAANTYPFVATSAAGLVVLATVADLACCGVTATWQGCTTGGAPVASQGIGGFYLDYDIEFKGPIDSAVNI